MGDGWEMDMGDTGGMVLGLRHYLPTDLGFPFTRTRYRRRPIGGVSSRSAERGGR
jgi:hypothetical protein